MNAVQMDVRDAIGWLTFNRPQVANAVDQAWLAAMEKALDYAQDPRNGVRCLILKGAGKHFCSGIDLRSTMVRSYLNHPVERLLALRLPIVAAVNGAAAGSGMTLALTADIIVMSDDAYFLPSFARIGVIPDSGISYLLKERIGASRARAVLMLGERIDALKAFEWGLAYEVVSPEKLHAKAEVFAARLAAGPRRVLGITRALFHSAEQSRLRKQLSADREAQNDGAIELEHAEGRAAFLERREPHFEALRPSEPKRTS